MRCIRYILHLFIRTSSCLLFPKKFNTVRNMRYIIAIGLCVVFYVFGALLYFFFKVDWPHSYGHFHNELQGLWPLKLKFLIGGNAETVPLHFTLSLRAKGTKEVWMDGIPTWSPTWHEWVMFHGLPDFAWTQNWEIMTLPNLTILDLLQLIV